MAYTVNKLTPHIGVELIGLDVAKGIDAETASKLREALEWNYVVLLRNQNITPGQQVEFAKVYGTPDSLNTYGDTAMDGTTKGLPPEIFTITNDPGNVVSKRLRGAARWHPDMGWSKLPCKASVLFVKQLPAGGTNTAWCAMYPAYDALPEKRKAELEKLRAVHSTKAGLERDNPDPTPEDIAWWNKVPPVEHPLVWTHQDGRKSLLLGPTMDHIVGMSRDESEALRQELEDWCTQPQYVYDHNWKQGDLLIWYNSATMHKAPSYSGPELRLLHRVTIHGDEEVIGITPAAA